MSVSAEITSKRKVKPSKKALEAMAGKSPKVVSDAPKRPRGRPRKVIVIEHPINEEVPNVDDDSVISLPRVVKKKKEPKGKKEEPKVKIEPTAKEPKAKAERKVSAESQVAVKSRGGGQAPAKLPAPPPFRKATVDFFDIDSSVEPTDDLLADTLKSGIADGTMELSDSDYEEELDSDIQFLGAVTSTPFVRKSSVPKGAKAVSKYDVKVSVHDGLAMRTVTISSTESLFEILEKICIAIKRPNHKVEMGYEAPWSSKIGTKKLVSYISNDDELAEFWRSYGSFRDALLKKQKGKADTTVSGIVFHNVLDGAQGAAKRTGGGGKAPKDNDNVPDPRESAKAKMNEAAQRIQVGMFCKKDNRLCYQKYDGSCGAYTPDNVLDHATQIVQGASGVVPDKVPPSMTSKLLDYTRPGRKIHDGAQGADLLSAPNPVEVVKAPVTLVETTSKIPADYPAIWCWLQTCEDDFERGRDKHPYTRLVDVFDAHGCTRIDDITRMSPDLIQKLATEAGVDVTLGLVYRVFQYAADDVSRIRRAGRSVM